MLTDIPSDLAAPLTRARDWLALTLRDGLVERLRDTARQADPDGDARRKNLRGAGATRVCAAVAARTPQR